MGNISISHEPDPITMLSPLSQYDKHQSKKSNTKDFSNNFKSNQSSTEFTKLHPEELFPQLDDKEEDSSQLSFGLSPISNWGDNLISQTLGKMDSRDTAVELDLDYVDGFKTLTSKQFEQKHSSSLPTNLRSTNLSSKPNTIPEKNILKDDTVDSPIRLDDGHEEVTDYNQAELVNNPETSSPISSQHQNSTDSGNVVSSLEGLEKTNMSDSAYSTSTPIFCEEPENIKPKDKPTSSGNSSQGPSDLALPRNAYPVPLKLRTPSSLSSLRSQSHTDRSSLASKSQFQNRSNKSQTDLHEPSEHNPPGSPDSSDDIILARRNTYSAPSAHLRRKITGSKRTKRILARVTPRSGNHANLTNSNPAKYGTNVGEGHDNYALMYNMLTGIRVSVSRCTAKPKRPLAREDFQAANKLAFDVTGNELTPSSKYDFKFKDYAPSVFRSLRDLFGIDPAEYLLSLTLKYILSELSTPGKSGSFFYYSQDFRFIIKTVHHNEHKFFRKILPGYYNHVQANPNTLISRIYGLHRVKMHHTTKIHFVVMANLFPPTKDIHSQFDLKGSTFGRYFDLSAAADAKVPPVLKDLNWIQQNRKLHLGPIKRNLLFQQLKNDVDFLALHNIMDYSLLLGIHSSQRGNRDKLRQATLSMFDASSFQNKANAAVTIDHQEEPSNIPSSSNPVKHRLPMTVAEERLQCVFYRDGGGFMATTETDDPGDELYCMGIIDIMTPYSFGKRIEHVFKSIGKDPSTISAVDPKSYAHRFLAFMTRSLSHHEDLDPQLAEYSASHPTKYRLKQE